MGARRLIILLSLVGALAVLALLFTRPPEEPGPANRDVRVPSPLEPGEIHPIATPDTAGVPAASDESPALKPDMPPPVVASNEALADASVEIVVLAPAPNRPTGIEGYVYGRGNRLAGARVSWRASHDVPQIPPKWQGGFADEAVMFGPDADLTTENPFRPEDSFPVRLGGGFAQFDTAIVRAFPTEPGKEYELTFESRYLQGFNNVTPHLLSEGIPISDSRASYGIDLTGQTLDHAAQTIAFVSVIDGPNNMWRQFRTRFRAEGMTTSLWLTALQHRPYVNIAWFDGIAVSLVEDEDDTRSLLESPADPDESPRGFLGTVLTGAEGFYRIENLQPGNYDILADYPDLGSARKVRVLVEAGELASVNLTLYGGEEIRGTVRDALSNRPIPGAAVTADIVPEEAAAIASLDVLRSSTVRTDSAGVFQFDELLSDVHYRVMAQAPGFIPSPGRVSLSGQGGIEISLQREGGLTGIVVDRESGKPVPGAFVRVLRENLADRPFRSRVRNREPTDATPSVFTRVAVAESGENGRFSTPALDPGDYSVVAIHHGRLSAKDNSDIRRIRIDSPSDTVEVKLELESGGTLRGKVVEEESGDPVPGLRLGFRFTSPVVPSDIVDDGAPPGEVSGENRSEEKIHVLRERMGKVWDMFRPSGNVWSSSPPLNVRFSAVTDRAGRFEIEGMGRGVWSAYPQSEDYTLRRGEPLVVDPPRVSEATLTVRLVPRIEGTVVDRDEFPVAGARVWWRRVFRPERDPWTPFLDWFGLARSDTDGRFSLRVLGEDHTYDLMASNRAGDLGVLEGAHVGDPKVVITLEPAGGIEGRVWLHPNFPMAGAKVRALGEEFLGGTWFREARTDGDGSFRLTHLVEGAYTLEFEPWGGPVIARYGPVDVPHGEIVRDVEVLISEHGVNPPPTASP